jgi:hypothetical protein
MLTLSSGKTKTFKLLLSCGTDCGRNYSNANLYAVFLDLYQRKPRIERRTVVGQG